GFDSVYNGGFGSGSNSVVNGTFAADTDWTKGTGWTIAGGVGTKAAGTASTILEGDSQLISGRYYRVTYTITRTAGTVAASIGGTAGVSRNLAGTYTETIVAGATTTIGMSADAAFAGSVDNLTVVALGDIAVGNEAVSGDMSSATGWTLG